MFPKSSPTSRKPFLRMVNTPDKPHRAFMSKKKTRTKSIFNARMKAYWIRMKKKSIQSAKRLENDQRIATRSWHPRPHRPARGECSAVHMCGCSRWAKRDRPQTSQRIGTRVCRAGSSEKIAQTPCVRLPADEDKLRTSLRSHIPPHETTHMLCKTKNLVKYAAIYVPIHNFYVLHRHRSRKSGRHLKAGNERAYQLQRPPVATSGWPRAIIEDICDGCSSTGHRRLRTI